MSAGRTGWPGVVGWVGLGGLGGLGCAAPAPGPTPVTLVPSAWVPSVPVASFPADGNRAELVVELDGEALLVVSARIEDRLATAAVVGIPAGATVALVPVLDGQRAAPTAWTAPDAPPGLIAAVDGDPDAIGDGVVLGAVVDEVWSGLGAWDAAGRVRWWVEVDPAFTAASPRLTRDGRSVLYAINDRGRATDDQQAVVVALDGSAEVRRATPEAHHMVAELDRGELAWLAWDIRDVPWDGGVVASVLGDDVVVGVGDGTSAADVDVRMSFFDDRGPAVVPCSHGLIPDQRLGVDVFEWTHANSIAWVEPRDELVVGARLLDAVLGLDRATGAVRWQLGGVDATMVPDLAWSHGHLSDAWDGGLLMFDNGSHREPPVSRVVEYAIDVDAGEAHASWVLDDPDARFVPYLGDARRLPSGDVLVAWGDTGAIEVFDRSGARRWSLALPDGEVVGRIRFASGFGVGPWSW